MSIRLYKETKDQLIASIKRYFDEEMDDEVGDLKAALLLDFFLQELGPTVYNIAVADAQANMQEKVSDLDGACYETEFTYWKKK